MFSVLGVTLSYKLGSEEGMKSASYLSNINFRASLIVSKLLVA